MIMPPNEHNAMAGAQPWADPQNPGALQIPANSTACQMAMLSDTHNRQVKEHNTLIDLAAKLKQQILDAVDHTHTDELSNTLAGFAAATTAQLLTHLMTRCCEIKRDGIKANNGSVNALCSVMREIASGTAEAELGALFHNGKEACSIRTTLEETGHPQPPTPIEADNNTAAGIASDSGKQK
jgi:hypothetical protein